MGRDQQRSSNALTHGTAREFAWSKPERSPPRDARNATKAVARSRPARTSATATPRSCRSSAPRERSATIAITSARRRGPARGAGLQRGPGDQVLAGRAGTRPSANALSAARPRQGRHGALTGAASAPEDLASQAAVRPDYRNDRGAGVSAENLSDLLLARTRTGAATSDGR
jgi:hypothetical protein